MNDNLTREEAARRAGLISDVAYDVTLDLTGADETFGSRTVVRFGCAEPGASTFIDLDARHVHSIELNGRPVPTSAFADGRIPVDGLEASNELRIDATCAYQSSGTGMHHFRDPVDGGVYLHTQFEPFDAHRVYACFDQPDLKATFALTVDAPEGWEVVSNAAPTERPDEGRAGRWRFATTPVMSTYITAMCAGPFHVVRDHHEGIDLGLFCRRSLAEHLDPEELFTITKQGFDFFQAEFDYPYPFGKYDQVFCPEYKFGAMENAGCVTFTEHYIFRSRVTDSARLRRGDTILHEMAHMWFGDLVTMRWWDDLWLNESFATYMANVALARATRFTEAWTIFATSTKAWAYREDQLPTTHPIVADIPDVMATHLNFDGITYAKGASVLKQLVAWVGEDAFREGLRDYFRTHEWGNTTLLDFLGALEKGSGRDLRSWSSEWLQTAGVNTVSVELTASDGSYDEVAVLQSASEEHPHLRPHRMRVALFDETDGKLTLRRDVELDVTGDRTVVEELAGERAAALVLPNHADLAYAKIAFDDRSLRTVVEGLHRLEDSLARALCWNAAWDMVRDAQMRARDYVALVINNAERERDIGVVQTALARAGGAIGVYGDPANRDAAAAALSDAAWGWATAAEGGSDRQLAFVRTFAGMATTDAQLDRLVALLDGSETLEGLAVDTDLRWGFLVALASSGRADEDLIAAELERDPTDEGIRHAATCRAARPTAEAKAAAWRRITEEDLPLATLRALVGGFQQHDQEELLEPYVERYFDTIGPYWDEKGVDRAITFVGGLFPRSCVSTELLGRTEQALQRSDLPSPIVRLLREGHDDLGRILRGRERDRQEG